MAYSALKLEGLPRHTSTHAAGVVISEKPLMPAGVLLTIDGKTIYHAGDTGLFSDMKLIGDRHPIDLAFLPIGDNFTMGAKEYTYSY